MGSNEMIGHDPLAWIKEEPVEAGQPVEVQQETVTAAPAEVVKPTPVQTEEVVAESSTADEIQESVAVAPEVAEEASVVEAVSLADQGVIDLGEQLVISNVGKVRAEWMDRIVAGVESPIVIEGGGLQMVDTAGLQLVIALIRELNEDGVSWQWGGRSDLLQSSAEQLGISGMMSL